MKHLMCGLLCAVWLIPWFPARASSVDLQERGHILQNNHTGATGIQYCQTESIAREAALSEIMDTRQISDENGSELLGVASKMQALPIDELSEPFWGGNMQQSVTFNPREWIVDLYKGKDVLFGDENEQMNAITLAFLMLDMVKPQQNTEELLAQYRDLGLDYDVEEGIEWQDEDGMMRSTRQINLSSSVSIRFYSSGVDGEAYELDDEYTVGDGDVVDIAYLILNVPVSQGWLIPIALRVDNDPIKHKIGY